MGPTSKQTGDSVSVSWTRVRRGRALWEGTARPGCSACRRRDPGTAEFQNEGHSHVEFSRHCYISLLITTSFICDPPPPPEASGVFSFCPGLQGWTPLPFRSSLPPGTSLRRPGAPRIAPCHALPLVAFRSASRKVRSFPNPAGAKPELSAASAFEVRLAAAHS